MDARVQDLHVFGFHKFLPPVRLSDVDDQAKDSMHNGRNRAGAKILDSESQGGAWGKRPG